MSETPLLETAMVVRNRPLVSSGIGPISGLSNEFFEAPLPGCPIPVRVEYSAIQGLHSEFSGAESIGVLLGSSTGEAVCIERCELISRAPATKTAVRSLQGTLRRVIRAGSQNPADGASQVLGLFRTQRSGRLGATESDRDLAEACFPAAGTLFLVIQTTPHRPWLAALTHLRNKTSAKPQSFEFPFEEHLLRGEPAEKALVPSYLPMEEDPVPPIEIAGPFEIAGPSELAAPSEIDPPDEIAAGSAPRSWIPKIPKNRWLIGTVLVITLIGGAGVLKWSRGAGERSAAVPEPLALKVTRNGKDFEVSWNRLSKGVLQAFAGTLTIRDGALKRTVQLDETQLREGKFVYSSMFEELSFRLEVMSDDLRSQAESVQVLTWSARPPAEVLPGLPNAPDSVNASRGSQPSPR